MLVHRDPSRHMTISSTRSCSQKMGPLLATNRRKLTVVIGSESGEEVESNAGCFPRRRGLADRDEEETRSDGRIFEIDMDAFTEGDVGEVGICCGRDLVGVDGELVEDDVESGRDVVILARRFVSCVAVEVDCRRVAYGGTWI